MSEATLDLQAWLEDLSRCDICTVYCMTANDRIATDLLPAFAAYMQEPLVKQAIEEEWERRNE